MVSPDEIDSAAPAPPARVRRGVPIGSLEVLAALLVLLVVPRGRLGGLLTGAHASTWTTVFVSVLVRAAPFLVFGVVRSAVIAVFVPPSFRARADRRRRPGGPLRIHPEWRSVVVPGDETIIWHTLDLRTASWPRVTWRKLPLDHLLGNDYRLRHDAK